MAIRGKIEWDKKDGKDIARVTQRSPLTGKNNTMELQVTPEQIGIWQAGQLIQYAMPQLNADEREFLISGSTPDDWKTMFPPEDE